MTSLKGKTLFISGASRGIGLAIALRAARDGANVAIAAKTAEPHPKLEGTIYTAADEVRAAGGKALPVLCDIRDEAQVMAAIDQTVAEFGGIDICVTIATAAVGNLLGGDAMMRASRTPRSWATRPMSSSPNRRVSSPENSASTTRCCTTAGCVTLSITASTLPCR